MLAPGASMDSTMPEATGSLTAEKMTGSSLSSVAACMLMATGVAMPTMASTSSAWKSEMIWEMIESSALPFW